MFDVADRQILLEVHSGVYVLSIILHALPSMACILKEDEVLCSLYDAMNKRLYEMYPEPRLGQDIEEFIVCGFGPRNLTTE